MPLGRIQNPSSYPWPTETPVSQPFITNTELGFKPMPPVEDLGPLLDMAADFDWVCRYYTSKLVHRKATNTSANIMNLAANDIWL